VRAGFQSREEELGNEARVFEKIQAKGGHKNLISVLRHGELDEQYYFFDMELCLMNLEHFIHGNVRSILGLEKYFDPWFANSELGSLSFWGITKQLLSGLDFLHSHGELHRDLKPRNGTVYLTSVLNQVFLSITSECWKITDFDFTKDGKCKEMHSTENARGTDCYRAPELVKSGKVGTTSDIWALGCIIHALVSGRTAFNGDTDVWNYSSGKYMRQCPSVVIHGDYRMQRFMSQLLQSMFEEKWENRPSASDILKVLPSLLHDEVEVYVCVDDTKKFEQRVTLSKGNKAWDMISWRRCWYTQIKRTSHISIACNSLAELSAADSRSGLDSSISYEYACDCDISDQKLKWAFFLG
jgi:serine/threonine protein kinase